MYTLKHPNCVSSCMTFMHWEAKSRQWAAETWQHRSPEVNNTATEQLQTLHPFNKNRWLYSYNKVHESIVYSYNKTQKSIIYIYYTYIIRYINQFYRDKILSTCTYFLDPIMSKSVIHIISSGLFMLLQKILQQRKVYKNSFKTPQ